MLERTSEMSATTPSSWRAASLSKVGTVGLILLIAVIARLNQVGVPLIWFDEAFSVWLARLPLEQMIYFTASDVHPPLYYLVLHYWMVGLGDSVLAVRGLSVLFGTATVAVGMLLVRRVYAWPTVVMAGLLLALFPIAVRYSQETRMYAMHGFLMLSALYALSAWTRQQRSGYLLAYMLLMILGMYTHYFTLLAAMASWVCVALLRGDGGRRLILARSWWLCNLTIALAMLPWLATMLRQATEPRGLNWIELPSVQTLPLATWRAFTLGVEAPYVAVLMSLLLAILLIAGALAVRLDQTRGRLCWILAGFCCVPLLAAWFGSYYRPMFMERYLLFALLCMPILLAIFFSRLSWYRLALSLGTCLALEGVGLVYLYTQSSNLNGGTSWIGNRLDCVMAEVGKRWQPGDVLVAGTSPLILDFYNKSGQPLYVYSDTPAKKNDRPLYPASLQLIVTNPSMLVRQHKRMWWLSDGKVSTAERELERSLIKQDEIGKGTSRALLFVAPSSAGR